MVLEIAEQLGWELPDWIVVPGGNLGNVSALAAGLDLMRATGVVTGKPRLCVAQASHADPLYRAFLKGFASFSPVTAKRTSASAIQIGNPVSRDKAIAALQRYDGVVESATEAELADAAAAADLSGAFACPHTGVALARYAKRSPMAPSRRGRGWWLYQPPMVSSLPTSRSATTTATSRTLRSQRWQIDRAMWPPISTLSWQL